LLLDDAGVARVVASRGISEAYRRVAEGHFPWALDDPDPRPIVVPDTEQHAELASLRPALRAERIRALAFIPLLYHERLVGKFMIYFAARHEFGRAELELANAVAYLVAFAIQRSRLAAALREADARKDAFLATLAHELRNPLAPASAALALMAERPDDVATLHRAREILERSIRQIVRLVDDLLDVSRITRGMIELDKQPVELASVIHHAIEPAQPLIAAQQLELTLDLEPVWVEADELRIEQVISNLVHNAAKYTRAGGHIRISSAAKDEGVEIRVEDDGIGIAPDTLAHMFDLFAQADQSLARTRGGLGIGLTIVRELVKLHGGTVSAASAGEGKGAVFTVCLPGRVPPQVGVAPTPAPHAGAGPHRRVLVVDDNEDAASTLAMLLEALGHEVSVAGDGYAAIDAVHERHPEIVLLDLGLPGMSGYEVAEKLRQEPDDHLRIIAVSGYGQPDDLARSRAAGCDAHLVKPVDLATLERLLA
jgi:signal transduction histidine kinase/CheY-like chemotaxis protein